MALLEDKRRSTSAALSGSFRMAALQSGILFVGVLNRALLSGSKLGSLILQTPI